MYLFRNKINYKSTKQKCAIKYAIFHQQLEGSPVEHLYLCQANNPQKSVYYLNTQSTYALVITTVMHQKYKMVGRRTL